MAKKGETCTHFASNRTGELMAQMGAFRERLRLSPEPRTDVFRRDGLRIKPASRPNDSGITR